MDVYNTALRILGNPADAEDAAQDAFLRAFQRLDQYRLEQPFGAWLHGITRNRSLDVLRARRQPAEIEPAPATDVEREALKHLEADALRSALESLSTRDQALLKLRYWEDQSADDIGAALGLSAGAVRIGLLRARRMLAAQLQAQEVME
jgi:RNA polymerase sigma-70 factor (ECF subfamily)